MVHIINKKIVSDVVAIAFILRTLSSDFKVPGSIPENLGIFKNLPVFILILKFIS